MILLHALLVPEEQYNAEDEEMRDNFDWWASGDYVVNVLYDATIDRVVYHEDNVHGHPDDFIEGYTHCLRNRGLPLDVHKAVIVLPQRVNEYNYIEICPYVRDSIELLEN